MELAVSRQNE